MTNNVQMLTYLAGQGLGSNLLKEAVELFKEEGQFAILLSGEPKEPKVEIVGYDNNFKDKLSIVVAPASIIAALDESIDELVEDAAMAEVGYSLAQELIYEECVGL